MRTALAALALVAAACSDGAPPGGVAPTERLHETFEDGKISAVSSIIRGEQGEPILHGPYQAYHRNGEIESSGSFLDGKRSGAWISRWPNGFLRSEGSYEKGERTGIWTLYDERGRRTARGRFRENHRWGGWTFWRENGEVDESRTGFYVWHAVREFQGEQPTGAWWEGETFNRDKHGRWTLFRQAGTPILTGEYAHGKAHGSWLLYGPDGSAELEWVSGEYRDGARVGPFTKLPPGAKAPFEAADLERAPIPEADEGWLAQVDAAAGAPSDESFTAREAILRHPRMAYPALLARLVVLDLASPADERRGRALCEILGEMWSAPLSWKSSADEEARLSNQRAILQAYTLWELLRSRELVWTRDLLPQWRWTKLERRFTALGNPEPPEEFHRAVPGGRAEAQLGPLEWALGTRFTSRTLGRRRAVIDRGGAGIEQPLAAALDFLAAAQGPDGLWDPAAYEGDARWRIGVSAQCLLALLGDAHTLDYGKHRDTVRRGLHRLVLLQDPATGGLVEPHEEAQYEHVLALEALAEAACLSRLPALLQATARARDHLLGLQRADGSWARDSQSDEPDPATTARAVLALLAVREASLQVGESVLRSALAWLDSRSAVATGQVEPGRPAELAPSGELAVTAQAALGRLFRGESPQRYRAFQRQSLWIPQQAAAASERSDVQDLCWASAFAIQLGASEWEPFNLALKERLIPAQRAEGSLAGSLDPSPWARGGGGRLHATALFALALESYYRFTIQLRAP